MTEERHGRPDNPGVDPPGNANPAPPAQHDALADALKRLADGRNQDTRTLAAILESQMQAQREQTMLQKRQLHLRAIDSCDGSDPSKFIQWLRAIEAAGLGNEYELVELARLSAKGSLREALQSHSNKNTWQELRPELVKLFFPRISGN